MAALSYEACVADDMPFTAVAVLGRISEEAGRNWKGAQVSCWL